ncbi:DUF1115 domain protein [Beauveria brongniartii RCEF 3172]|uniref:DUF1115 domain protein n=1 Tax=Beauveria brongniartii RCEF 3172 TaxID=1081107 RepID=A0A167A9I1_9HYPO|nr:DUF1115 domain protein [Beauveria brongniartii RCEF 3172]
MENDATSNSILPLELLEAQLGQIDLLMAMYPAPGSVVLGDSDKATLERLRDAVAENSLSDTLPGFQHVGLLLGLELSPQDNADLSRTIQLRITIPLCFQQDVTDEAPPARIRLQQPSWMSKAEANNLMAELPQEDDLFATIDNITAAATSHFSQAQAQDVAAAASPPSRETESLTRVWFYFPSISTRSKRDDLVRHAPAYGLTGFLLAGKPGILCVEGGSQAVDDYMKYIKTESWGDIPAHHKKVSERYRQTGLAARAFAGMCEITGELERRGERANRNDMRALEAWLGERGLGDAFAKVLI